MYLPPPLIPGGDCAGFRSYITQDTTADTKWKHPSQPNQHDGKRLLSQVWEWAALHITSWTKSASTLWHDGSHNEPSSATGPSVLLRKRTTSQDLDVTIGVVVGVLLGVFLLGTLAFCYVYRDSIRLKRKKKFQRQQRRHRSGGSHGSKSSKSSRSSASSAGGDGGGGGGGGGDAGAAAPPAEGG
ncbi:hypothetical protein PG991_008352 [Apiospora marii]|uniref:WW domain-containing protein n=1 Tax=Apiospora marii TaxID=335849 RepID=A0ABR1RQM6_9PEZI